jgi:hypothetical protein
MKKIMLSMLLAVASLAIVNTSKAQVSVNINIGVQPEWGPAGYDYAEYYYMPDIEAYYYVPNRQFVYFSANRWVFSSGLPPMYSNYNLYSGYKVVVNSHDAYRHFNDHRVKYVRYKNQNNRQVIIKNKHDNGNHNGQYKNKHDGQNENKGKRKSKNHGKDDD